DKVERLSSDRPGWLRVRPDRSPRDPAERSGTARDQRSSPGPPGGDDTDPPHHPAQAARGRGGHPQDAARAGEPQAEGARSAHADCRGVSDSWHFTVGGGLPGRGGTRRIPAQVANRTRVQTAEILAPYR